MGAFPIIATKIRKEYNMLESQVELIKEALIDHQKGNISQLALTTIIKSVVEPAVITFYDKEWAEKILAKL
jgi:hypothetical protein